MKDEFKSSSYYFSLKSIQLHIEELRILLEILKFKFDIIAISKSKLNSQLIVDINLKGHHSPCSKTTEATEATEPI